VLAVGAAVTPGRHVGERRTFADLGQTLADVFDIGPLPYGTSFLPDLIGRA